MAVFQYQAIDSDQNLRKGTIQSESARGARDLLRGQGLSVQSISACLPEKRGNSFLSPSSQSVTQAMGDLGILLNVGVPLDEGIQTITGQLKGEKKRVWQHVYEDVSSGKPLSEAFSSQPLIFDPLTIALVEVGENTGSLDEVIGHLSQLKQRAAKQKGKVFNALMYPFVILLVACFVTIFLMTNVLPTLLENLTQMGKELPWPTKILKFFSDLFINYWIVILAGTITGLTSLLYFRSTTFGRKWLDQKLLQTPLLGNLLVKQEISRVAMVLSILLDSGMDFIKAIRLAESNSQNTAIAGAFKSCRLATEKGKEIGTSFKNFPWIPPVVIQVFTVGQESGNLHRLLKQLSNDYDQQVEMMTERLTGLIEPIMIVVLSVVIGFVVFATFLPILESGNVL